VNANSTLFCARADLKTTGFYTQKGNERAIWQIEHSRAGTAAQLSPLQKVSRIFTHRRALASLLAAQTAEPPRRQLVAAAVADMVIATAAAAVTAAAAAADMGAPSAL
jgi:hypothetical protein